MVRYIQVFAALIVSFPVVASAQSQFGGCLGYRDPIYTVELTAERNQAGRLSYFSRLDIQNHNNGTCPPPGGFFGPTTRTVTLDGQPISGIVQTTDYAAGNHRLCVTYSYTRAISRTPATATACQFVYFHRCDQYSAVPVITIIDENTREPIEDKELAGLITIGTSARFTATPITQLPTYCRGNVPSRSVSNLSRTYTLEGGPLDQTFTSEDGVFDTRDMEAGEYSLEVMSNYTFSNDTTFRRSTSTSVTVVNDESDPNLEILFPRLGQTLSGMTQIRAEASDLSGIRDIQVLVGSRDLGTFQSQEIQIPLDTTTLPEGINIIQVRAVDNFGNDIVRTITVEIDNVDLDPEIRFSNITSKAILSGTVAIEAEVFDDSPIEFVNFFVDGEAAATAVLEPYSGVINTEDYPNGSHTIRAVLTAQNGKTIATELDVIFRNGDFTPPAVEIISHSSTQRVSGIIELQARARDDSGIAKVDFFAGTTRIGSATSEPYMISYDTENLSDGLHQFAAVAYDTQDNFSTYDIPLVVQNVEPVNSAALITSPAPNSILNGVAVIEAVAVDNVAVREVRFFIDDKPLGAAKIAPYRYFLDTNPYPRGNYTLRVEVLDYSNSLGEATVSVTIDNTIAVPANPLGISPSEVNTLNAVEPQVALRSYASLMIALIDDVPAQASSTDEHKLALNALMQELIGTMKENKKMLREDDRYKKMPRHVRRVRRVLRKALKKLNRRQLRKTKRRLERIVRSTESS